MLVFGYMDISFECDRYLELLAHGIGLGNTEKEYNRELKKRLKNSQPTKEEILGILTVFCQAMIVNNKYELMQSILNDGILVSGWNHNSFMSQADYFLEIPEFDKSVFESIKECMSHISAYSPIYKDEDVQICQEQVDDYIEKHKDEIIKHGKEELRKYTKEKEQDNEKGYYSIDTEKYNLKDYGSFPIINFEDDLILTAQKNSLLRKMLTDNFTIREDELAFEIIEEKVDEMFKNLNASIESKPIDDKGNFEDDMAKSIAHKIQRKIHVSHGNDVKETLKEYIKDFKIKPLNVNLVDGQIKFTKFDYSAHFMGESIKAS
jgi:hypothetical protein